MISEKITIEDCQFLSINQLADEARIKFKEQFIKSNFNVLGHPIKLTTTKTRFNGTRFWFICPSSKHRASKLYIHPQSQSIGCQRCLNLPYRKQRYKGMIEAENLL